MSTRHTPGPWEAVIYGGWDAPRIFSPSGSIAILQHHESGPGEAEANALLIEAAPGMLALLIELVDIEGPQPGTSAWGDKARAAIKSATRE